MDLKIRKISDRAYIPRRATEGAAAYDVYLPKDLVLHNGRHVIPLDFALEIPKGYCAEIQPRSGYASKGMVGHDYSFPAHGVLLIKDSQARYDADVQYGLIDSDYRGCVGVIINNHGIPFALRRGERIAQMLIRKVEEVNFIETTQLSDTERADGGFGHTNN